MRAGSAKSYAISSIETQERGIFAFFDGASGVMVSWLLTCKRLLYESSGAVIWLAIDRAPQVLHRKIDIARDPTVRFCSTSDS